jgi:hypothetical protein
VTPSDDLFPPRRPIFFPVVIATVFLTIIGGTVGYMLGQRHRNDNTEPERTTTSPVSEKPSTAAPAGPPCPPEAIRFAADNGLPTDLTQVFKAITTKGTTVWICRDGGGSLYYQSKRGGVDAPLVQGDNALFLPGVSQIGEDDYQVTASVDGNRFEVNRRRLLVRFAKGKADLVETVKTVE